MLVGGAVDELRGDANVVTGTLHGSLDDPIHIEFTGNFGQGLVGFLVAHGGGAGDDFYRAQLSQAGNQRVSHAVGEIFLGWVTGKIGERKNSEGADSRRSPVACEAVAHIEGV